MTEQMVFLMPWQRLTCLCKINLKYVNHINGNILLNSTLQDTELKGYFIPKHTRVVSVTWAVDHDTKLWGKDVHEYKPERFLSQDGSKVVKPEYAMPFSIGKYIFVTYANYYLKKEKPLFSNTRFEV
ncbi:hypothetical protein AVEN_112395-1 [Araneus ventricosus]|uniref:Uncharacterized protein n=1 Tax=Araneus ventricosus TaxID=182803 RepID=A0A4Y2B1G8_ARAVE|nr:hypothetical protein AVEN_112395-1 [Araneus ventricosus]